MYSFCYQGLEIDETEIDYFTDNHILSKNEDLTFEFGPFQTFLNSELKTTEIIGQALRRDYSINLNYKSNNKLKVSNYLFFHAMKMSYLLI